MHGIPSSLHAKPPALVAQINAAMRAVAMDEKLPMIDYEALALQMPDAGGLFLKDGYHVQPAVQYNVMLNVLLNEYAAATRHNRQRVQLRTESR